eukprot:6660499-Pyramimonas_sp.AAC.1
MAESGLSGPGTSWRSPRPWSEPARGSPLSAASSTTRITRWSSQPLGRSSSWRPRSGRRARLRMCCVAPRIASPS